MSDNSEVSFSNFGIYDLESDLELSLPNTAIKFHRISDNAFSYFIRIPLSMIKYLHCVWLEQN